MCRIVIYGAASSGKRALEYYGRERVIYFCDGDENKVGTFFEGIEVISKSKMLEIQNDVDIIIASVFYEEITKDLFGMGINEIKRFVCYEETKKKIDCELVERLDYRSVLEKKDQSEEKKCVLFPMLKEDIIFVVLLQSEWIVIKSVYDNCQDLNCAVIVCGNADLLQRLLDEGVRCFNADDYDLEERKPHAVVYVNDFVPNYSKYQFEYKRARKYTDMLIFIPFDMVIYGKETIKQVSQRYLRQNADLVFVNPDYYEKFLPYQDNLCLEGNPKFDYIYDKVNSDISIPDKWKAKINGRPVILWGITHGLADKGVHEVYSFDLWFQSVVRYFLEHREYVLIFRPHICVFDELIAKGIWSYQDCKKFEVLFDKEENFILDLEKDYGISYHISDVLISDASGLLLSYLSTGKPIIYTATERMGYSFSDPKLIEHYYIAKDSEELGLCMDEIFGKNDPLYEQRLQIRKRYIPKFDGKIGFRIAKTIKERLHGNGQ